MLRLTAGLRRLGWARRFITRRIEHCMNLAVTGQCYNPRHRYSAQTFHVSFAPDFDVLKPHKAVSTSDAEKQWSPFEIFGMSGSFWQTFTLHAGVKLDLFTALGQHTFTAPDVLASRLNTDKRGLTRLCNALTALGLVQARPEGYGNAPGVWEVLSTDSQSYMGFIVLHHTHLVESWAKLDEAVRSGRPVRDYFTAPFANEEEGEAFLLGMRQNANVMAPLLAKHLKLADRKNLLDFGGRGAGVYALHFCKDNPELKATVFDVPCSQSKVDEEIEKFGLRNRVSFTAGDFFQDEVESSQYDSVLISHVLRGYTEEECAVILRKAVSALQPGGWLALHEFILDGTSTSPVFPAMFSLNMLLQTVGGQAYTEPHLQRMLENEGLVDITRLPLQSPNQSGLLVATKPA